MREQSTTNAVRPSAKLPVTTLAGQKIGEADMTWSMGDAASPLLITQNVLTNAQHARIRRAHTKDRSEVRGGGRKPWRQKGTGRARHGSSRSPLWVGGGTTFGPRTRHEYVHRLTMKMRQRALEAVIGQVIREGLLEVVRIQDVPTKTRDFVKLLPINVKSLLIITSMDHFTAVSRAGKNLKAVKVVSINQLSVSQIVAARQLWLDEDALTSLKNRGFGQ